ncbi:hypothetical protein PR048_017313 [Dryococelus australis]|uniref:GAG-pre-integrase domain-containing protein n=1 Tax=Dryococelus australis TaxID=614101 RepID=A0ABQ9H958_9NEOP|nr:hypothetical protein PR048_017313 [Dryococelus australis]
MDDTDKICHLLLTMEDNFNTFITAIETMKQDSTTEFVDNVVSSKIMCYVCGKVGHKRKNSGPRAHQADISFTAFSCELTSKDIFILDSGTTNHLVVGSLEDCMSDIRTLPITVVIKTANAGEMIATRARKFMGNYASGTISFEALIVPDLKNNLLSISKLIQKNLTVVFSKKKVTIKGENISVECEKGHFNLLLLKLNPVTENTKHTIRCQEFGGIITTSETSLWHRRLGHLNK